MIGKAGAGFPTAQFLCDEIRHGEDVELLIEKTGDPKMGACDYTCWDRL